MSCGEAVSLVAGQAAMFLDDDILADASRAQRIWHQAKKLPMPVLAGDRPWERGGVVAYGSVLHWQGRYHLWYCNWVKDSPVRPSVCYAVSDDGVSWAKPSLGLVEVLGSHDNNIVFGPQDGRGLIDDLTVIQDPGDEAWPLKMLFWDSSETSGSRGIHLARSADGIHWERQGLVLSGWGDRFNAVGRIAGRYVVLGRAPRYKEIWGAKGRCVFRAESPDLLHWSEPQLVLQADLADDAEMEIYSNVGFRYEGLLLGGIERMHMSPDVLETEIAWSRDLGATWRRSVARPAFIQRGHGRSWDDSWINLTANDPVIRGSELWFWYSGRAGAHGTAFPHNIGGIGLATLRRDGFCSIRTAGDEGCLLTVPLRWPGGRLEVNYDPRRNLASHPGNVDTGQLRIEVREDGQAVAGFAAGDCQLLRTNTASLPGCRQGVTWAGGGCMSALAGRVVQLAFFSRDTHLYSFAAGMKQD